MNLLNVFAYVFEADTREFKKGVQEADKQASDLEKTVKRTDATADQLGQSFKGVLLGAGQALAAYLSVSALMTSARAAATYADELGLTSQALRVNASELDAWAAAQVAAGGSSDGLKSSVRGLRQMLDELRVWGVSEGAYALEYFGVSLRDATGRMREPLDILPQLAAQFERLSRPHQMDLANRLGLDEGTVMLLQRGRRAVEELVERQKQLGTVTEKDTQVARDFHMQIEDTRRAWQRLTLDGNSTILPFLTRMYEIFEDGILWVRENKDLVTGFILGVAGVIVSAYLPAVTAAAAATLLWLGPWLAIGAAVGAVGMAIALLYEDWKVFMEDGDSALGEMIRRWPILGSILRDFAADMRMLGALVIAFGHLLADIFTGNWTGAFDRFADRVSSAFNRAGGVAGAIRDAWKEVTQSISEAVDKLSVFYDKAVGAKNAVLGFLGFGDEEEKPAPQVNGESREWVGRVTVRPSRFGREADESLRAAERVLVPAGATPLNTAAPARVGRGAAASRRNEVNIDKIDVNTQATDADGISAAIGESLSRELRTTIDQFDDGVEQ